MAGAHLRFKERILKKIAHKYQRDGKLFSARSAINHAALPHPIDTRHPHEVAGLYPRLFGHETVRFSLCKIWHANCKCGTTVCAKAHEDG